MSEEKLLKINIKCPECGKEKVLTLPKERSEINKALYTISIPSGFICEHCFQAFIDKNNRIRGYQKVDFEVKEYRDLIDSYDNLKKIHDFYNKIISEVFHAEPLFKILIILHGEKNELSIEELKNITGIAGAEIRHTVFDLNKHGLVSLDESSTRVKLTEKLF